MGSETIKLLPTIDFSQLKQASKSPNWESVKNQVRFALQEFGCFEATFNQIPRDLPDSVIQRSRDLFELPLQSKVRNSSNKHYHGYIGQHASVPLYESLGIDDALGLGSIDRFTNLMWSQGNPDFRSIRSFTEQLAELDQIVRRLVLESLGLEKYIDEHIESTNYLIRVQKYDSPKGHESELGLPAHTDKNMVTILYQNEVNGLELLTKDGRWIVVEPSPDSFVVMIGQAFHAWTNGRLHSVHHRVVMMEGSDARYSIGLFSVPKEGYIIKAPEEMVDEENPLLFKPYDHFEFVNFFYTPEGLKSSDALKAYCGA